MYSSSPRSSYSMDSNCVPLFKKLLFLSLFCILLLSMVQGVLLTSSFTKVGVVLDIGSRMGKEQETAIQIAAKSFNRENFEISIHFVHFNQSPLQIAFAVEALLKEEKVEVIIVGIENWQVTSLVAQIGATAQVPTLSLASSPPIASPFPSLQWPFLIQLSHNATQQIKNIASIIKTYHWRRVIVVYEDDTISGTISVITQALQKIGSQIEHHLVLPPLATTTNNRKGAIKKEMKMVDEQCYSRVFVVLKISLPYVGPLFEAAKEMGLMRNDSVWITTETINNFLPSFDSSTVLNMDGVIGFMTNYDNSTVDFQLFEAKFGTKFLQSYKKEVYNAPSYEALLAYDAIKIIMKAKDSHSNTIDHMVASKSLLRGIMQINFKGLSGPILFNQKNNNLAEKASTRLVNIVGANHHQISYDFTTTVDVGDVNSAKTLTSEVNWPGNMSGGIPPKGWKMPTYTKKMRIGVPIAHNYKNFINYSGKTLDDNCLPSSEALVSNYTNNDLSGYCIRLFDEVVKLLDYELPYELIPVNCSSYDVLIKHVHNKTFDAAIGDISILANRSEVVDFTLPFAESGLSIILPVQQPYDSHGPWIFLKPFTSKMWFVTFCLFLFTMLVIWVLERGTSENDFKGPWKEQLCTIVWFAFNSLYFAQREKISTTLARVVMIMWLFIVLILTASYTASLTSMLTNERLNQTTVGIEIMLQKTNTKVGLTAFVNRFLKDLLKFDPKNVVILADGKFEEFHQLFQTQEISAACFELLYAELFLNQYCKQYVMTKPIHRFGGFGFAFPKGSPVAIDVSEAILKLTEYGELKKLEKHFLDRKSECINTSCESDKNDDGQKSSLSLASFRILFCISGATTTVCLLASFIPLYAKYRRRVRSQRE